MKYTATLLAATAILAFTAVEASAQSRGVVRAQGQNGAVAAGAGPNGAFVRGRGAVQNSDGSVTAGSAGAVRGPAGARAARGSTTTVNPDGSASRESRFGAAGANGAVSSSGSSTRNADGTYTGARNTQAVGAQGGTYPGATT